jgi:hypothetical protein
VQPEPDAQQDGQAQLPGGGLTDGEAFGEVVQADADRDEQCQAVRRLAKNDAAVADPTGSSTTIPPGPNRRRARADAAPAWSMTLVRLAVSSTLPGW